MAHGSKRWIIAVDARLARRLKRSRHRTSDDVLGPLAPFSWRSRRDCPECAGPWTVWDSCRRCREVRRAEARLRGCTWPGRGAPRWFRQQLECQYRARVRHILAVARYDDARYELLPATRRKDAAWLFW